MQKNKKDEEYLKTARDKEKVLEFQFSWKQQ